MNPTYLRTPPYTAATKSPDTPDKWPNLSMTRYGTIWSNLVIRPAFRGSHSLYIAKASRPMKTKMSHKSAIPNTLTQAILEKKIYIYKMFVCEVYPIKHQRVLYFPFLPVLSESLTQKRPRKYFIKITINSYLYINCFLFLHDWFLIITRDSLVVHVLWEN